MEKFLEPLFLSNLQLFASIIATGLTFYAFYPYIKTILEGTTKPHVFSWIIWSLTTIVVFFAQYQSKAGFGSWPTGISGLITCFIALLSYSKTRNLKADVWDWAILLASLVSIPVWYWTSNPLYSVIILTLTDTLGFIPTLRKAYRKPEEENSEFYAIFAIRSFFSILALEVYSLVNILFPLVIGIASLILVIIIKIASKKK